MEKAQYKTKQREELLEYLKSVSGSHITVSDICEHFSSHNKKIGMTTVYRQLEKMVSEGLVKKYLLDTNSSACFEYIDVEKSCHEVACYHLICIKCGKLFHLHCDELADTESHISKHHGFQIDMNRTIFYGQCEDCQN